LQTLHGPHKLACIGSKGNLDFLFYLKKNCGVCQADKHHKENNMETSNLETTDKKQEYSGDLNEGATVVE
jgi:hypothetical protein